MAKADPGATIVYRTGKQLSSEAKRHDFSDAVHLIRHYYNLGLVHLVQRRAADGFFEYIAAAKERISPPIPAFSSEGVAVHRFVVPKRIAELA